MKRFLSAFAAASAILLSAAAWAGAPGEVLLGKEGKFAMTLPDGYKYDALNYWYAAPDGKVHLTPADTAFYSDADYFEEALKEVPGEAKTSPLGKSTLIIKQEKEGFNGPSTLYFINFNGQFKSCAGCRIRVSNFDGLEGTQSPEILKAVSSVRRHSAFMDLPTAFDKATTAAMTTFMTMGRYAADGTTVYGQAFDSKGKPEFVRLDLEKKGSFYEVKSHRVIEKGVQATYISLYGDYVFYIRAGKGIWCARRDGSSPRSVIEDAAEYLQIRGDRMYWCDAAYKLKAIDMTTLISIIEGKKNMEGEAISLKDNIESAFDKEIYYAFMLDDAWLIYQDDADHESLHLRHLPTGADAALTAFPGYGPVVYGSGLYFKAARDGKETLARLDMASAKVTFNEETDSFSCAFPGMEYSEKAITLQHTISTSGFFYAGRNMGWQVNRWKEVENPGKVEEVAYKLAGPDFDILWKIKNDLVSAIGVESSEGGVQNLPHLD